MSNTKPPDENIHIDFIADDKIDSCFLSALKYLTSQLEWKKVEEILSESTREECAKITFKALKKKFPDTVTADPRVQKTTIDALWKFLQKFGSV